jgi:hypothetical protein
VLSVSSTPTVCKTFVRQVEQALGKIHPTLLEPAAKTRTQVVVASSVAEGMASVGVPQPYRQRDLIQKVNALVCEHPHTHQRFIVIADHPKTRHYTASVLRHELGHVMDQVEQFRFDEDCRSAYVKDLKGLVDSLGYFPFPLRNLLIETVFSSRLAQANSSRWREEGVPFEFREALAECLAWQHGGGILGTSYLLNSAEAASDVCIDRQLIPRLFPTLMECLRQQTDPC